MELKTVKYEPCEKDDVLSGHVVLKKPSIDDLFEGSEIAKQSKDDQGKATKDLLNWSKKFYIKVDIKNVDGSEYKSFDDLTGDAECLPVLNEVAVALVQGINRKKLMTKKEEKAQKTMAT